MRASMVGTRKAEVTRWRATSASQAPASKRGWMTVVSPEYRLSSSPSMPPTWNDGHAHEADAGRAIRVERAGGRRSCGPPARRG